MSKRSAEDTIAGYYYQFDKTILEILNRTDDTDITVEGIEDIDIEDLEGESTFIQCKYHAKTKYVPSAIKKPIQAILKEYTEAKRQGKEDIQFVLYAHFKENQNELADKLQDKKIKEEELAFLKTELLSGKPQKGDPYAIHEDLKLSDEDLKDFINRLTIDIEAKDIDKQGKEVIEKIKEEFDNCSNREADYYYNNALKIIFQLATKQDKEERKVRRGTFKKEIDTKKFLFNKWYAHLKGKKQYLQYVKWKLTKSHALASSKHKYLFLGKEFLSTDDEAEKAFETLIRNIVNEYFKVGKSFSSKSKVWTIVLDCDDSDFSKYKTKIYDAGLVPWGKSSTGGFKLEFFNRDPVINTQKNDRISKTSFDIKLITFDDFKANQSGISKIESALFFSNKDPKDFFQFENAEKKACKISVIEQDKHLKSLADINLIFDEVVSGSDYLRIVGIQPNLISVEVTNPVTFKDKNESFSIGSFVKITDDNSSSIIGMLQSYKIKNINDAENEMMERKDPSFILDIVPMGFMKDDEFKRGGQEITIPPNEVSVADSALLKDIFSASKKKDENHNFSFGTLSYDDEVDIILEGNNFFNKHIAVVGSSGSGKSCTVAQILQSGIQLSEEQKASNKRNNARVIIFDLHGEYKSAFPDCNYLSVDKLKLPYWLLNGEELADLFIDSSEFSSHNQYNQLKDAIILNKKKYNPDKKIDFDTPAFFNLTEVIKYIENQNKATIDSSTKELAIATWNEKIPEEHRLFDEVQFRDVARGTISRGPFNSEFDRFITRLESRKSDNRLDFILKSGEEIDTSKLPDVIKQFLGFSEAEKANVTIVDLSGISFDVLSVAVSLISRLMFNFMYYAKKVHQNQEIENPLLLVFEEAHNYIPKHSEVKYKAVRESIERIAKEGRKYGVSAMIVSQRPSEISETIFSQCNSFVVMRLTNPADQNYIKKLLPDMVSSVTENLSGLESREALVLGSSIPMPTILRVNELAEHQRPKSTDVNFMEKWKEDWNELEEMEDIVNEMVIPQEPK